MKLGLLIQPSRIECRVKGSTESSRRSEARAKRQLGDWLKLVVFILNYT